MKNKVFILTITITTLLFSLGLNAQERVIHGMITTFDSIPLIDVNIRVHSTKQTVLSDTLGYFSVSCNSKDRLKIMANGFYTQNVKLKGNIKFVAVNMKLRSIKNDDAVAIGYGYVSEKDKLNAIDGLTNADTDFLQYNSVMELIRGNFAGVQIVNGEIIIRGARSLISSNAALIVVDGVISDQTILNTIRLIEVKSINVIKDGSSAIYGSRGANGVVLIETKKGGDE